jgi:hypothetical protein
MKGPLYIFIGGSDEQNGDYTAVHRLAQTGGTARWSSLKDARPGDRALICVHLAMASTGRSMVRSAPKLTAKGDTVRFYVERPISAIVAVGKAPMKP